MAHQLSIEDRERISQLRFAGMSQAQIAKQWKRSPSTVSRELKRNSVMGTYSAVTADRLARLRRQTRTIQRKMENKERLRFVTEHLAKCWSPEQISGRLNDTKNHKCQVSHQTIYQWIKSAGKLRSHWESFLRRKRTSKAQG